MNLTEWPTVDVLARAEALWESVKEAALSDDPRKREMGRVNGLIFAPPFIHELQRRGIETPLDEWI